GGQAVSNWKRENLKREDLKRFKFQVFKFQSRKGLSLAEVMISLAISAMLLTAVAAAFTASSEAIEQNDEFFRASQAARVSMNQILTECRRCKNVKWPGATSTDLSMIGHDGNLRDYFYDATKKKLQLITSD